MSLARKRRRILGHLAMFPLMSPSMSAKTLGVLFGIAGLSDKINVNQIDVNQIDVTRYAILADAVMKLESPERLRALVHVLGELMTTENKCPPDNATARRNATHRDHEEEEEEEEEEYM